MIVLSDNDIVLKLAGCHLLPSFLERLSADLPDVFITESAKFSVIKQAKKKISDEKIRDFLNNFIQHTSTISAVDDTLLAQIQQFEHMDGGESRLILSAYENPNAYLATGDKRCLKAVIRFKDHALIDQIYHGIMHRVLCLESAIAMLIEYQGFETVKSNVLNRCIEDGTLNLAFKADKGIEHTFECLTSYCQDFQELLIPNPLFRK